MRWIWFGLNNFVVFIIGNLAKLRVEVVADNEIVEYVVGHLTATRGKSHSGIGLWGVVPTIAPSKEF